MASKIEWTDETWNPIAGCSLVSPGCTNCYAMREAHRLAGNPSERIGAKYAGTTQTSKAGPVWTGRVNLAGEAALAQPLRWSKPRRIFVNSMSDLFHPAVPDAWIDRVFAVMALCPQHVFQVLTKRPERMRAYLSGATHKMGSQTFGAYERIYSAMGRLGEQGLVERHPYRAVFPNGMLWPLPNVWLGVSAEDQARADERIPVLLDTPAAVRWVSAEPLLGPIDFCDMPWPEDRPRFPETDDISDGRSALHAIEGIRLDWIVVGGESGRGARPMHPDWARSIRDQCAAAGVAFHFKQWGAWSPRETWVPGSTRQCAIQLDGNPVPHDVTPQNVGGCRFVLAGKRTAGRLLDGRTHDAVPEVA